nr:hypothetical protein [Tanacetum cinerariifolium]
MYKVKGYTEDIIHIYEQRLKTVCSRSVNRVHVLYFARLTEGMMQTLDDQLRVVYTRDKGQELFTIHAWRRLFESRLGGGRRRMTWRHFILVLGLHTDEEMTENGFGAYLLALEKVFGVDLFYLRSIDRGTANVSYLLAQYLFRHAEGWKSGARLFGGHFIWRLATHFGLLERLNIYERISDTWAWVALRLGTLATTTCPQDYDTEDFQARGGGAGVAMEHYTPLFDGMLVPQQAQDVEDAAEDEDAVNEVSVRPTPLSPTPATPPSPTPATPPPPPQPEHIPSPPQAKTTQPSPLP